MSNNEIKSKSTWNRSILGVRMDFGLDKKEFLKIYHHATTEPFSFLHISGATQEPDEKYRKRFESYLKPQMVSNMDDEEETKISE